MKHLFRFKFYLWYFSRFKIPLIGLLKPKLIDLTEESIVIMIPLHRRSKNHLNSMYFGALAVGADLAGGFHGYFHAALSNCKISLAFKSFQATFLKRPESDVYFVSDMGLDIKNMINEAQLTRLRINRMITVKAYTNYFKQAELTAEFILELSIKVI